MLPFFGLFGLFGVNGVTFGRKIWMIGCECLYSRYGMSINDLK